MADNPSIIIREGMTAVGNLFPTSAFTNHESLVPLLVDMGSTLVGDCGLVVRIMEGMERQSKKKSNPQKKSLPL